MTEINPFSRKEKENSIINMAEMNEINNFTESSENDFQPMQNLESLNSFNESSLSLSEAPNRRFPNFPIKSIFIPDLFLDKNSIQNYLCGLCENVCDDPVRAGGCKCGKIFCKNCLNFYYNNRKKECPLCNKYTNGEMTEAQKENIFIKSQKMRCVNYKENCPWEDICGKYKEHIEILCHEEIENCPNKIHGCVLKLKRKNILEHLGKCEYVYISCEKCGIQFPEKEKNSHKLVCENEVVNCPYNCGNLIMRKNLEKHKTNCDFCMIKCPYNSIGCNDEFKKKDEKKRLNDERDRHMNLLKERILFLESNFSKYEQQIKKMEEDIQFLKSNNTNNVINNININNNNNSEKEEQVESQTNDNSFHLLKSTKRKSSCNSTDNGNIIENNILPLEEKESIYNLMDSTKQLFNIENNTIEAIHLTGKKHYYVFFDEKFDIPRQGGGKYKIRFKLLSDINWLGFGLCDKKILEINKYEFDPSNIKNEKRKNNGTYYLNTNKMAWNCNNSHQCKSLKFDGDNFMHKKYSYFEFSFTPIDCELEIKLNNIKTPIVTFTDVRCLKSKCLSPCIIFLRNCKVETTFYYQ